MSFFFLKFLKLRKKKCKIRFKKKKYFEMSNNFRPLVITTLTILYITIFLFFPSNYFSEKRVVVTAAS